MTDKRVAYVHISYAPPHLDENGASDSLKPFGGFVYRIYKDSQERDSLPVLMNSGTFVYDALGAFKQALNVAFNKGCTHYSMITITPRGIACAPEIPINDGRAWADRMREKQRSS